MIRGRETLMICPDRELADRFERELDIDTCSPGVALYGRGYNLIVIATDLSQYAQGEDWFNQVVLCRSMPNGQIIRLDRYKQAEGAR